MAKILEWKLGGLCVYIQMCLHTGAVDVWYSLPWDDTAKVNLWKSSIWLAKKKKIECLYKLNSQKYKRGLTQLNCRFMWSRKIFGIKASLSSSV